MAKVLLVAEPDGGAALHGALVSQGLEVSVCTPKEAAARARDAEVIAVAAFADDATAPRFVGHLVSTLGAACAPVVAQVVAKSAARDAALIAGAADVAFDADADHFAARVAASVSRWVRHDTRKPLDGVVRGQSGRTALELKVTELDDTGLGLASTAGVTPRQLVRLQVPLVSGPLLLWGRVAQSEGVAGVRFLGLSEAERATLREALDAPPQANAEASASPSEPAPPAASEPADAPDEVAAVAQPVPASARASDEALETSSERAEELPSEESSSEEIPSEDLPSEEVPSEGLPSAQAPLEAAPASDLSSLIGDALHDELSGASEGDLLASILDSGIVRRWPESAWDTDACIEVLRDAAPTGLVSEVEHAPSTQTVLSFLRTLSPIERRAFDQVAPAELPPAPLTTRCLALRLRCFALVEDARARTLEGPGWVIDGVLLTALKAEADLGRAELQKLADELMVQGETSRLRDVNNFANALHTAYISVTQEASRLKGEAVTRDRAVLLDVAENDPEAAANDRPKAGKAAPQPAGRAVASAVYRKRNPQHAARRRLIVWCGLLVAAVALRVVLWPEPVQTLDGADVRSIPGLVEIKLPPAGNTVDRPQAAAVSVVGTWRADDAEAMGKLKAFLRAKGASRFAVFDGTGTLLATGGTGVKDQVVVTEIPAP